MASGRYIAGVIGAAVVGAWALTRKHTDGPLATPRSDVERAIRHSCGNLTRAALELGVAEKTLHAVLNRHRYLRRLALVLRRRSSRTGHGRPPRGQTCSARYSR